MLIKFELIALMNLAITMVLCGALGWERATVGKSAGLRTHILVGMGAALFVSLAHLIVRSFASYGDTQQFDPTRVLEAVAAAVSFLGAGTIVFTKGKERIRGLTTAASLWATSAIGMTVALGHYVLAVGATLLILVVLRSLLYFEQKAPQGDEDSGSSRLRDL